MKEVSQSFFSQLCCFIKQGVKSDLFDLERFISPVLFAALVLLLFNFIIEGVAYENGQQIYVAEVFISLLFALQLSYLRIFSRDQQDKVFEQLQTTPINYSSWYVGKFTLTFCSGCLILLPVGVLAALFHGSAGIENWDTLLSLLGVSLLSLFGLASLGVLLSSLTLKSSGRETLFPILYFPLSVPVLLAGSQASLSILSSEVSGNFFGPWLGLLVGFNVIYFTLGILLFEEIVGTV